VNAPDTTAKTRVFSHKIRVPYAHVDQMGFVYYANYLIYFEMARAEFLREVGLPYADMEARGIMLPVVRAHLEYRKPAHFDEWLEVRSTVAGFIGSRLRVEYEIVRGEETIVTGYSEHVCMAHDGRVMRPAPELKVLLNT
jgi:acyl-CoA thioester hydrolase